jgi:hypothetical protein
MDLKDHIGELLSRESCLFLRLQLPKDKTEKGGKRTLAAWSSLKISAIVGPVSSSSGAVRPRPLLLKRLERCD